MHRRRECSSAATPTSPVSKRRCATQARQLTGPAGVGKTSLARVLASRTERGALWVDLASLTQGERCLWRWRVHSPFPCPMATRGPRCWPGLAGRLLVLDNAEHLIDEVAGFVEAQVQAPGIRWLATSQEPLHVAGEVIYRLGPLDVPAPDATLADAMQCGALALLCQRAAAADRHFRLTDTNLGTAIDLCRQLDGLPLAIEMAAARIAILGLHGVHGQLGQRLRRRADARESPARHHTLRSTFDWSHALLSDVERAAFRRLEPFLGGFTASMAQQVTADIDTAKQRSTKPRRWRRSARSSTSRWYTAVQMRRIAFFCSRARAVTPPSSLPRPAKRRRCTGSMPRSVSRFVAPAASDFARLRDEQWGATYVSERHNVRAALAWACEAAEPDVLARLVAALGVDRFVRAVAGRDRPVRRSDAGAGTRGTGLARRRLAGILELGAPPTEARNGTELALRALSDFRSLGDTAGEYRALAQLARLYESRPSTLDDAKRAWEQLQQIDIGSVPLRSRLTCEIAAGLQHGSTRSVERLQELEDMARRSGFGALAAVCRARITDELLIERRFDEVVASAQRFGMPASSPRVRGLILLNQALALVQLGRAREACGAARAALRALPSSSYVVAATFALAAARDGRLPEAALMAGYAERARRERDERPDPAEADAIAETAALLHEGLAAERLNEFTWIGTDLSAADLIDLALPA